MVRIEIDLERTETDPAREAAPERRVEAPGSREGRKGITGGDTAGIGVDDGVSDGNRRRNDGRAHLLAAFLAGVAAGSVATRALRRRREAREFTEIELEPSSPMDR